MRHVEVAIHGLTHTHPGERMAVEFQGQNRDECRSLLRKSLEIFAAGGLRYVSGFQAPGWNAPPALCEALCEEGFRFLCSARDVRTPVGAGSRTMMSGLAGASLILPTWIDMTSDTDRKLLHITTNFQATSTLERALEIIDAGGLLSIKAHIFKSGGGITLADGLDEAYINYLDLLCRELDRRYGERLWWTSHLEVAERCRTAMR
jgi:hypothetical protein